MTYTLEKWIDFHAKDINPADYETEFQKWLDWRLKVDRGETRGLAPTVHFDIAPYQSPVTGQAINSRSQRNEDLQRTGSRPYEGLEQEKKEVARQRHYDDVKDTAQLQASVAKSIYELPPAQKDSLLKGHF